MPAAGKKVTIEDIEEILDAVKTRGENFPEEPEDMTWMLVLINIGNRYASVACIEGEWVGKKKDIPPGTGVPTCPNGHPLIQSAGLHLGWLAD